MQNMKLNASEPCKDCGGTFEVEGGDNKCPCYYIPMNQIEIHDDGKAAFNTVADWLGIICQYKSESVIIGHTMECTVPFECLIATWICRNGGRLVWADDSQLGMKDKLELQRVMNILEGFAMCRGERVFDSILYHLKVCALECSQAESVPAYLQRHHVTQDELEQLKNGQTQSETTDETDG